ncbi:MAG: hypothetical protein A3G80_02200 [Betaproteobacteria bacterium RIFCSPLOWO2_12_FULL_62_13b]|nr:MAG: hypothetical protein A3G80_02200 [Betaproteobacteria bacterium RIFCSPLOWO2_12_FULL_62_13b]
MAATPPEVTTMRISGAGGRFDAAVAQPANPKTGQPPTGYSRGAMSQACLAECSDGKRIGLHLSSPDKFREALTRATDQRVKVNRWTS